MGKVFNLRNRGSLCLCFFFCEEGIPGILFRIGRPFSEKMLSNHKRNKPFSSREGQDKNRDGK